MFGASISGLVLQSGITGAATVIMIFTPTVGVGCRSLWYILHGTSSLIIMYLTIASTILARISETRRENSATVRDYAARFSISLRRFCFSLALFNAVGLVVMSASHFTNVLGSCYCNGSVISRGKDSYVIMFYFDWIPTMMTGRIVGTTLAGATMAIYMCSLRLFTTSDRGLADIVFRCRRTRNAGDRGEPSSVEGDVNGRGEA